MYPWKKRAIHRRTQREQKETGEERTTEYTEDTERRETEDGFFRESPRESKASTPAAQKQPGCFFRFPVSSVYSVVPSLSPFCVHLRLLWITSALTEIESRTLPVSPPPAVTTAAIRARRGPKAVVDPRRAYAFFRERERSADGIIEDVGTVLLTNRECPFTCVFCDLWRHTLDAPTPRGSIVAQLQEALPQLAPVSVVKLYNAGNFFDPQAIPPEDWPAIAKLVNEARVVIVENHPRLTDDRVLRFREMLPGRLEVALGLETAHEEILVRLNKQMTVADFERAARWLRDHDCDVRAFVQLGLPGLIGDDDVEWTVRSIETAFAAGAQAVSVIPSRAGNGLMDDWQIQGVFTPPRLESLHAVQQSGLALGAGRVFVDLWNAEQFASCPVCASQQVHALHQMNLTQSTIPWPECRCSVLSK